MLTQDPNKTIMGPAPTVDATITIKPIQCPVCKTFNPAGVMFCIDCGLIFDRALPDDAFGAPAIQVPCLVDQGGREHPLRPGVTVVGREGDINTNDARTSRRHAQVTSENGVLTLEDLGSTNGTTLNGDKLDSGVKKVLKQGDTVAFGGLQMKVSMPGSTNATAIISANKTAAMAAAPQVEQPAAYWSGEGEDRPLKLGSNSFGRKSDNDITISDAYVSGRHGTVEVTEEGVFLTDIGSTNGTLLNDAKLNPNVRTMISEDDEIKLGSLTFRVRIAQK